MGLKVVKRFESKTNVNDRGKRRAENLSSSRGVNG
jgi:hypothetical protein